MRVRLVRTRMSNRGANVLTTCQLHICLSRAWVLFVSHTLSHTFTRTHARTHAYTHTRTHTTLSISTPPLLKSPAAGEGHLSHVFHQLCFADAVEDDAKRARMQASGVELFAFSYGGDEVGSSTTTTDHLPRMDDPSHPRAPKSVIATLPPPSRAMVLVGKEDDPVHPASATHTFFVPSFPVPPHIALVLGVHSAICLKGILQACVCVCVCVCDVSLCWSFCGE
jgi:hypothetical protein